MENEIEYKPLSATIAVGPKKLKPTYADKISRFFVYDCIQRAAFGMG
jgi:hypothetical protein